MTTSENIIIDRNTPLDVLQQEAKKGNGRLGKGTAMVGCGTFSKVKIRPYTEEEMEQFRKIYSPIEMERMEQYNKKLAENYVSTFRMRKMARTKKQCNNG